MANKIIVQQLRNNQIYNTGNAKLPKSTDFNENEQYKYGTLALNYHKEQESITTINDENQVIAFNYNLNLINDSSTIEEQVYECIQNAKSISINNEWIITHRIINEGIITLLGGCFNNNKIEYIKVIITADKKYTKEISEIEFNAENISYKENINVKAALDELFKEIDNINSNKLTINNGEGINIEDEGTIKTISTNLDLNIVTVKGKEMLQLVDGSDNSKVIAEVDASKFVLDGMLSSAEIFTVDDETELPEGVELSKGKYIKLTWNTDAVKTDTYISVADLISEHKVVAGEDVAGEFVSVATTVVESTDENGIKVSTVNVTVDDSAVKTALDAKIGKDDVMLSFGGKNETYVLNRSTSETPVVLTGTSWRVEFECDHNYFDIKLKNSKDEEAISYSGTVMYGTMGYMQHDNGILTSDVFENPSERQIDPNESYSIELIGRTHQYHEEEVTLTVKVKSNESQQVFNTEKSIQYLNENKADKVFVEEHSNNTDLHVTQTLQEKWNNSVEKSHEHSNKNIIDDITSENISTWNQVSQKADLDELNEGLSVVNSLLDLKADKSEVQTKIGINDDMLSLKTSSNTIINKTNNQYNFSIDKNEIIIENFTRIVGDNASDSLELYAKKSGQKVFTFPLSTSSRVCKENGSLNIYTLNDGKWELNKTETLVYDLDFYIKYTNNGGNLTFNIKNEITNTYNTYQSLDFLNKNKANVSDVYTKTEIDNKGYLTEHQDISSLNEHIQNDDIHVTSTLKNNWNNYTNTLKITVEETTPSNDSSIVKQYIIKQGGVEVKTINIPKDLVVESGEVIVATEDEKEYDNNLVLGDKYLKLILNSSTANPIYIAVKDLVDVYTADETYIKESNNKFSLDFNKIDQQLLNSSAVGQQFLNLNNFISNVGNKANQAQNEVDALESVVTEFKEDYNDTIANINGNIIALQNDKANVLDVNVSLELKANKTDVYTKSECDKKFLTEHQDISQLATREDLMGVEQGVKNKIDVDISGVQTQIQNETSRATEKENELEASINNLNEELIKDEKVIRAAFEDVYYNKPINYAINTSVPYEGRCKKDAFDNYAVSQFTSNTYYGAKGLKGGDTITVTFDIEIDNTEWLDRTVDYDDVTGQHQTGIISLQMGPRWGYMSLSNVRFTESGKYHVSSTLQIPLKDYSKPTPVTEDIIGDVYVRYSYVKPIDESKPMIKITNFRINKGSKDMGWTPSVFDSEYNLGCNNITLTTSQKLPINKRLCNVVLSGTSVTKNITFGMHYDAIVDETTLLHAVNGQENHYIIYNSMSTDVTLTLPNTSNIVLLSGSSLTISPNSYAELNCIMVDDGIKTNLENQGRMYIRAIV